MARTTRLLLASVAVAGVSLAACNGQVIPEGSPVGTDGGGAGTVGSSQSGMIGAQVSLPPGVSASRVEYTLRGPGGFVETGSLSFVGSQVLEFVLGNVPPGDGYTLDVTTTSSAPDGSVRCTASASFGVLAGETTDVVLPVQCSGSGMVALGAPPPPATSASAGPTPQPPPQTSLPDASAPDAPSSPPPATPQLGSVDVQGMLPSGLSFSTALCELTGPAGLDFRATLTLATGSLHFDIQNVPAGMGDLLVLTATSTDGSTTCSARATFDILPGQVTGATLFFICSAAARDQ